MTIEEFYLEIGENFAVALSVMMDAKRVERFVRMFKDEPTYANLMAAFETNDIESAFRAAHTLKGLGSSLGFSKLSKAASDLTEYLRPKADMNCPPLLDNVKKEYSAIIAVLNNF